MSTLVNEGGGAQSFVKVDKFIRLSNSNTNLEIGPRIFSNLFSLKNHFFFIKIPDFWLNIFVNVKWEGGFAKCQHLLTRGREGVKNTQNPVNVVYE